MSAVAYSSEDIHIKLATLLMETVARARHEEALERLVVSLQADLHERDRLIEALRQPKRKRG